MVISPSEQRAAEARLALGLAVNELRRRRGLQHDELGTATGLSPSFVASVERGQAEVSFEALLRLSAELAVPLSELVRRYQRHAAEQHCLTLCLRLRSLLARRRDLAEDGWPS